MEGTAYHILDARIPVGAEGDTLLLSAVAQDPGNGFGRPDLRAIRWQASKLRGRRSPASPPASLRLVFPRSSRGTLRFLRLIFVHPEVGEARAVCDDPVL